MLNVYKELRKSVVSSTILIVSLTFIGYIVGFLTQIITAHSFGVSKELDAFIAARIIPELIFGMTSTILVISFVVIFPEYIKEYGEEEGKKYISKLFTFSCIILVFFIFLLFVLAPLLATVIAPGFSEEQITLTTKLIKILSITIIFFGLSNLTSGILYHEHKFFATKALRIILGVGIITGVLFLQKTLGIVSLAIGTISGIVAAFLLGYMAIRKQKYTFSFLFDWKDKYLYTILSLSWPLLITGILYYTNKVLINIIASGLEPGAISTINYAFLVSNVPVILFSESIAVAIFPHMTKQVAYKEITELKKLVTRSLQIVLVLLIPITSIFMIFNNKIIQIIFQRGAFTAISTNAVSATLFFFSIGLVPAGIFTVLLHILYATKEMKMQMYIYIFFIILNISSILILVQFMSFKGVALGISISNWCVCIIAFLYVKIKIKGLEYKDIGKTIAKIIPAIGAMGLAIFLLKTIADSFVGFIIVLAIAALIYIIALRIMRSEEIEAVINLSKKQIQKYDKNINK